MTTRPDLRFHGENPQTIDLGLTTKYSLRPSGKVQAATARVGTIIRSLYCWMEGPSFRSNMTVSQPSSPSSSMACSACLHFVHSHQNCLHRPSH